mmetsp:Transcript_26193/g.51425  ORF Transcript_26193/g.51425 Transcript_26193/m.51425 type:complete len:120 (+) Transcript_26193:329-688(+)
MEETAKEELLTLLVQAVGQESPWMHSKKSKEARQVGQMETAHADGEEKPNSEGLAILQMKPVKIDSQLAEGFLHRSGFLEENQKGLSVLAPRETAVAEAETGQHEHHCETHHFPREAPW